MKTKNFLIMMLMALMMPVGAWAAVSTVAYTDETTGIMYNIRISNNVPQLAVITGMEGLGKGQLIPVGSIDLTIPETLTFGNSSTSYTIPVVGITSVSVNGNGNGNNYLKSVTIGTNVTAISASAFKGCSYLQTVTITDAIRNQANLATVGASAFEGCTSLTRITLPKTVTSIGATAFKDCTNLKSVSLTTKASTIGENAFLNCGTADGSTDYVTLTIRKGGTVSTVPGNMLKSQSYVKSIVLNSGITTIAPSAFREMEHLQSVTLPSSLTTIGESAFLGSGLETITLNEGLQTIGFNAFNSCRLRSVYVPQTVTSIAAGAFNNCTLLERAYVYGLITSLPNQVFQNCSNLTLAVLPPSLTEIQQLAFVGCEKLPSITIPQNVSMIEAAAFKGCTRLKDVFFHTPTPPAVNLSGNGDLFVNGDATEVIPHSGITLHVPFGKGDVYKADTYWGDFNIEMEYAEVVVDGVSYRCRFDDNGNAYAEVGGLADESLTDVTFVESVTHSDWPDPIPVTTVGYKAFAENSTLQTVVMPGSITTLSSDAFLDCTGLKRVTLTTTLQSFPTWAFTTSNNLYPLKFDLVMARGAYNSVNRYFASTGGSNITSVTIGEGIETIYADAFADCTNMTSVTIPASVTLISNRAFGIANSNYSSKLTDVTVSWATPINTEAQYDPFPKDANGEHKQITLHVPSGKEQAYVSHSYWGTFTVTAPPENYITFEDPNVEALCVSHWDTNGDSHLSEAEAAAVTDIGSYFNSDEITTFDEFRYFTSVTTIPSGAFNGCTALTSITFPESLTTIEMWAFQNCSALTNLVIPEGVTTIGWLAFKSYTGIVTLPSTLTSLDSSSFEAAAGAKVSWPEPPAALAQDFYSAFGSTSNKLLYVPIGSYDIYEDTPTWWAFDTREYGNITFVDANVKVLCLSWDSDGDGELSAEEALEVTSFGNIFKGNTNITSFNELKNFRSLTEIPAEAFQGCSALTSIVLPKSITKIGTKAFMQTGLTAIDIPEKVTEIAMGAFDGCSSLATVNLSSYGIETIGSNAFSGTTALERITIPSSVTSMNDAFNGSGLKYVTVYWGGEWTDPLAISENTFTSRTTATLFVPEGTVEEYKAAQYWKDFQNIISKIEFNDPKVKAICVDPARGWDANGDGELTKDEAAAVTTLGMAFTGNTEIQTFEELKYFTGLKYNDAVPALTGGDNTHGAFDGCTNLRSVEMPANIEQIMNFSFRGCTSLANVNIPSGVHTILDYAFQGCTALSYVNMPQALESIGAHAFDGCSSLRWMAFPNQAITYGDQAFNGCSNLTQVTVNSSVPGVIDGNPFPNRSSIKLIVPPHTADVYSNTEYWNEFQIEEQEPDWLIYTDDEGNQYQYDPGYSARLYRIATQATEFIIPATITVDGSTLPVTAIAEQGATSSYMEHLTIPASVTKLKERALLAPELKTIHIQATTPPVATQALIDWSTWMAMYNMKMRHEHPDDYQDYLKSFKDITLYVPVGTKSTYELYDTWKEFTIEEELLETGRALADVSITYDIVLPPKDDYSGWATVLPDEVNNAICTAFQLEAGELWSNIRQYAPEQPCGSIMNYVVYGDELQRNDNSRFNASGDFGHWFNASGQVVNWGTNAVVYTGFETNSNGPLANVGQYPERNTAGDCRTVREAIVLKDAKGEEAKVVFTFNITFQTDATASATLSSIEYTWLHGDVDGTPGISINDALTIIDYILGKDVPTGFDTTKADVNGDGNVTIADATAVLAIILRQ